MRAACARAKLKPAVSFHILRHTWASLAVMNDTPLMVVAKNLGHVDTRMVEKQSPIARLYQGRHSCWRSQVRFALDRKVTPLR
jgi:integrase